MRKHIWTPVAPFLQISRYRPTELKTAMRLRGFFELDLIHARTGLIAQKLNFENLIVNTGLDSAGIEPIGTVLAFCAVGTGNAVPSVTDISLQAELARTNAAGGVADVLGYNTAEGFAWARRTRLFTTAQANGNIAEIGILRNSTGAPMWSRTLPRDGNGNPTVITKTSDFELRVTYELRIYPQAETIYSGLVNGTAMDITVRQANQSTWNPLLTLYHSTFTFSRAHTGGLGPVTGSPSGTTFNFTSAALAAYVAGNYHRDCLFTWGAATANATLKSFADAGIAAQHQHEWAVGQTKVNTQKLDILARQSWTRFAP